jgi:AcrR family transcriptional regulator
VADKQKLSYHHGDLRNSLIQAAVALVREKGPHSLSLREVAKKAGVSHTAPYRHFPDKNALICSIAEVGFRLLTARLNLTQNHYPEPRDQFIEAGVVYLELAVKNPEITQLMFSGQIDRATAPESLHTAARDAFNQLHKIVVNAQQRNLIRPGDPDEFALSAWSMMHGLAMLITGEQLDKSIRSPEDVRRLATTVGATLLDGLLAR